MPPFLPSGVEGREVPEVSGRSAFTRSILTLALTLISATAHAEAGWLSARGRLAPEVRLEGWAGTNSAGAGFVRPDENNPRAGVSGELAYAWRNRVVELRGARAWQLTPTQFGTASVTLGGAAHVVPEGRFDVGLGPHAGLNLSLGGDVFTVELGLQTGVELFFNPTLPRFPQRGQLSLNFRFGPVALGLHARIGADLFPGAPFVGRGELALSLGWLLASAKP